MTLVNKISFFFFVIVTCISFATVYSQNAIIEVSPIMLDYGVYDSSKVKSNKYKVLYGKDAETKFFRLVKKNKHLKSLWLYQTKDEAGNTIEYSEYEILAYYPDLKIVVTTGGHGYTNVDNIYKNGIYCGDPITYVYSPSRKYRISGIDQDGMRYFLEKKIDGKYVCLGIIFDGLPITGFYWTDDQTVYYLKKENLYNSQTATYQEDWVPYSTLFHVKQK